MSHIWPGDPVKTNPTGLVLQDIDQRPFAQAVLDQVDTIQAISVCWERGSEDSRFMATVKEEGGVRSLCVVQGRDADVSVLFDNLDHSWDKPKSRGNYFH